MQVTGLAETQAALRAYGQAVAAAALAEGQAAADRVTAYDKGNHPWTNRTGEAERRIACTAAALPAGVRLTNAHGVPYGLWLEVRWQGRYAILLEALQRSVPDWLTATAARIAGLQR